MTAPSTPVTSITNITQTPTSSICRDANIIIHTAVNSSTATANINTTAPRKLKSKKCMHKQNISTMNSIELMTLSTAADQDYNFVAYETSFGLGMNDAKENTNKLRIMDTVITEDSETTTNSPESLPFMPLSSSTSFAATTESVWAIGDYFPPSQGVTVSSSAPEYVSLPMNIGASSAESSPKVKMNNKFTRKRERACNNNSNSIVSRMPYFKAFSK